MSLITCQGEIPNGKGNIFERYGDLQLYSPTTPMEEYEGIQDHMTEIQKLELVDPFQLDRELYLSSGQDQLHDPTFGLRIAGINRSPSEELSKVSNSQLKEELTPNGHPYEHIDADERYIPRNSRGQDNRKGAFEDESEVFVKPFSEVSNSKEGEGSSVQIYGASYNPYFPVRDSTGSSGNSGDSIHLQDHEKLENTYNDFGDKHRNLNADNNLNIPLFQGQLPHSNKRNNDGYQNSIPRQYVDFESSRSGTFQSNRQTVHNEDQSTAVNSKGIEEHFPNVYSNEKQPSDGFFKTSSEDQNTEMIEGDLIANIKEDGKIENNLGYGAQKISYDDIDSSREALRTSQDRNTVNSGFENEHIDTFGKKPIDYLQNNNIEDEFKTGVNDAYHKSNSEDSPYGHLNSNRGYGRQYSDLYATQDYQRRLNGMINNDQHYDIDHTFQPGTNFRLSGDDLQDNQNGMLNLELRRPPGRNIGGTQFHIENNSLRRRGRIPNLNVPYAVHHQLSEYGNAKLPNQGNRQNQNVKMCYGNLGCVPNDNVSDETYRDEGNANQIKDEFRVSKQFPDLDVPSTFQNQKSMLDSIYHQNVYPEQNNKERKTLQKAHTYESTVPGVGILQDNMESYRQSQEQKNSLGQHRHIAVDIEDQIHPPSRYLNEHDHQSYHDLQNKDSQSLENSRATENGNLRKSTQLTDALGHSEYNVGDQRNRDFGQDNQNINYEQSVHKTESMDYFNGQVYEITRQTSANIPRDHPSHQSGDPSENGKRYNHENGYGSTSHSNNHHTGNSMYQGSNLFSHKPVADLIEQSYNFDKRLSSNVLNWPLNKNARDEGLGYSPNGISRTQIKQASSTNDMGNMHRTQGHQTSGLAETLRNGGQTVATDGHSNRKEEVTNGATNKESNTRSRHGAGYYYPMERFHRRNGDSGQGSKIQRSKQMYSGLRKYTSTNISDQNQPDSTKEMYQKVTKDRGSNLSKLRSFQGAREPFYKFGYIVNNIDKKTSAKAKTVHYQDSKVVKSELHQTHPEGGSSYVYFQLGSN